MKAILLFALLLLNFCAFSQEVIIEEAKLKMELPNEHWNFMGKQTQNSVTVYTWRRDYILDSAGRKIDPQISFILEPVDSTMDIVQFSWIKRTKVPFDVVSMFSHEDGTIKFKNGIGYRGTYEDRGLVHRIYLVHGIRNGMGITLVMDTTEELAEIVAPEFLKSLSTLDKSD